MCLKIAFRPMHVPLCGIFGLHSLNAALCAMFLWPKTPTKENAHRTERIFRHALGFFERRVL
ncbi:hypothetical protein D3Z58_20885 [Clostridiaceae bacterium]|nr:hypothetical protein [Clostridiaceae bacterium]